jgi:hypothetical protein
MFSCLLALTILSLSPPALLADDLSDAPQTMSAGDRSSTAGSSLRLITCETGAAPAQSPLVRRELPSGPTSASTSVTTEATPKRLFSRTKWEGPAAVVARQPELHWKGAFCAGRPSSAVGDAGVVRTSGELPLDTVQPVSLPNPPPPLKLDNRPNLPPPVQPRAAEPSPSPVNVAPSAEPGAPSPLLWEQLGVKQPAPIEKCIVPGDLKSIREITADISVRPEDRAVGKPRECPLGAAPPPPRHWRSTTFAWTAASTSHNPLYFEEEQLERYGHSWGNVRQTTISAVQFFATAPLLPYYMGVYPPNECIYDLGQYRPGSCAPYYLDPFPLSVRGALYEGSFLGLIPAL